MLMRSLDRQEYEVLLVVSQQAKEINDMKTSTTIIIISTLAAVFSVGIAIVDKQWTMDAFWPLIGGAGACMLIGIGNAIKKWRGR